MTTRPNLCRSGAAVFKKIRAVLQKSLSFLKKPSRFAKIHSVFQKKRPRLIKNDL